MFIWKNKLKLIDLISYILLVILSLQSALMFTEAEISGTIGSIFTGVEIFLFCCFLIVKKYPSRVLIPIILLFAITIFTYYKTGDKGFFLLYMIGVLFGTLPYKSGLNVIFFIRLIFFISLFILVLIGIIDPGYTQVLKESTGSYAAYKFGYTHPNRLGYTFIYLLFVYLCISRKIKFLSYVGIFIFLLTGYLITKSRTLLLVGIFTVILYFILTKKNSRFLKIYSVITPFIPAVCAVISVIFPVILIVGSGKLASIVSGLDKLLSHRFSNSMRALINVPVTFFGGTRSFEILDSLYNYSTVDNGYIRLLFTFGIFGFVVYLILTTYSIISLNKNQKYIYVLIIISTALWGVSENILTTFAFNLTAIFWAEILKDKNSILFQKKRRIRFEK